jgi:hypothetical protein
VRRNRLIVIATTLGILLAIATYWVQVSPQHDTRWVLAESAHANPYMSLPSGWRIFNASRTYDAGSHITGNATFTGHAAQATGYSPPQPRLCILSESKFKEVDFNKQIDQQAVGCFYRSYNGTSQTTIINFSSTLPETGKYAFIFIADTPNYQSNKIDIYVLHTEQSQGQMLIVLGLAIATTVVSGLAAWEHTRTSR